MGSINMAWAALKSAVGAAPAAAATQVSVAVRSIATVKPHVPLIKFRAGAPVAAATSQPEAVAAQVAPSAGAGPMVYEWYDTPSKYRKGLLDETELECINMGGADVKWQ